MRKGKQSVCSQGVWQLVREPVVRVSFQLHNPGPRPCPGPGPYPHAPIHGSSLLPGPRSGPALTPLPKQSSCSCILITPSARSAALRSSPLPANEQPASLLTGKTIHQLGPVLLCLSYQFHRASQSQGTSLRSHVGNFNAHKLLLPLLSLSGESSWPFLPTFYDH